MTDVLLRSGDTEVDRPTVLLRLLGAFELYVDHRPVPVAAGTQRLLAMLALRGRIGRSRLAGSLWGDTSEQHARSRLRTGLWRVNQVLPGLVVSTHGQIGLRVDTEVDVHHLVVSARRLLDVDTDLGGKELRLALDDGELLPDWEDEWLASDRERLRQLKLHVFEAMARRLSDAGLYGLALESGLAALRTDPLRESAYRTVIRIHLAEGNVGEARRVYGECAAVLARELGVIPSFRMDL